MKLAIERQADPKRLLSEEAYYPGEDIELPKEKEEALKYVVCLIREMRRHYYLPLYRQTMSIAERFFQLAKNWKEETEMVSSATALVLHPAYQQIIGMGPVVLPLILKELEQRPDHWFWALWAITGSNPVTPELRGDVEGMTRAWISWARNQGHRW